MPKNIWRRLCYKLLALAILTGGTFLAVESSSHATDCYTTYESCYNDSYSCPDPTSCQQNCQIDYQACEGSGDGGGGGSYQCTGTIVYNTWNNAYNRCMAGNVASCQAGDSDCCENYAGMVLDLRCP